MRVYKRSFGSTTILNLVLLNLCAFTPFNQANAMTLREALVSTYRFNPTLNAERARLSATKQNLPRAQALGRPTVFGSLDADYERADGGQGNEATRIRDFAPSTTFAATLQQPLFRGFSVVNGVREAKAEIYAGRADLRLTEQNTLLAAITAYMDALRYRSFTRLRRLDLLALAEQKAATQQRRRFGEATVTDVSQAEARHERAAVQLHQTRSDLQTAYAEFERVIGYPPDKLHHPRGVKSLMPKSLAEATKVAVIENPIVVSAENRRTAARFAVKKIRGELLPRADLNVSYSQSTRDEQRRELSDGVAVTARVTIPLYQGGDVYARIQQAVYVAKQRDHEVLAAQRQVRSNVTTIWNQISSIRSQVFANHRRVQANGKALLGLIEQQKRGQRTTTDVLNGQQELTDAEIDLVASQTESVLAVFKLASAMGRLTAIDLDLPLDVKTTNGGNISQR